MIETESSNLSETIPFAGHPGQLKASAEMMSNLLNVYGYVITNRKETGDQR